MCTTTGLVTSWNNSTEVTSVETETGKCKEQVLTRLRYDELSTAMDKEAFKCTFKSAISTTL